MHFKPNLILNKVKFVYFYCFKNSKIFLKHKLSNINYVDLRQKLTLKRTLVKDFRCQHTILNHQKVKDPALDYSVSVRIIMCLPGVFFF